MEFWPGVIIPRWIVTRVIIPRWNVTRVIIQRGILTRGHNSTLNCDPGSWFHVKKLPRVLIQHWNMTLGLNSTLNCDPESWLNVELWPGLGITIQCGILTRGHNSLWNECDPGSQFNVEFWPVYISSTRGIATQDGVKIQQRDQNSTAKEGHNSTKNPLNIDPGSVFNRGGGSNFYLTGIIVVLTSKSALWLISTTHLLRSQVYSLQ